MDIKIILRKLSGTAWVSEAERPTTPLGCSRPRPTPTTHRCPRQCNACDVAVSLACIGVPGGHDHCRLRSKGAAPSLLPLGAPNQVSWLYGEHLALTIVRANTRALSENNLRQSHPGGSHCLSLRGHKPLQSERFLLKGWVQDLTAARWGEGGHLCITLAEWMYFNPRRICRGGATLQTTSHGAPAIARTRNPLVTKT